MSFPPDIFRDQRAGQAFRGLIESAPDSMVIVDREGSIVLVNAQTEKLFGYPRHELIGKPVEMLVPSRFINRHESHRDRYLMSPHTRPMGAGLDLWAIRKDGSEFPVEISLSPIGIDEEGLVASAIRDITERRRFEQALIEKNAQLENANLAKDRFLAGMSHELRTPLNAIIGFTGTLLMKLPGPLTEDQEKQLRIVQSSARHLLSLINDILDLAKIQSGKLEVHFEPIDVRLVVNEVAAQLRSMAAEKSLEFSASVPPQPVGAMTDRRALHQILVNLVNNAIKYTPSGSVAVSLEQETIHGRPHFRVSVADTGIGIKPEDQSRLFQAFEQLDPSSTRRFEGAGLGLFLCRQLASLIGGHLTVASEPGKGSTFAIAVPQH